MAASTLMASDHLKNLQAMTHGEQNKPPETARKSCKTRKLKTNGDSTQKQKKKQPQRGMGVERLERLRLQERWKKMTEMNKNITVQNYPFVSSCFAEPTIMVIDNVRIPFAKFGRFVGANGGGNLGLNQSFHGKNGSFQVGNMDQASKKLSAKPNFKSFSDDRCGFCHKKKRINGGNLAYNGARSGIYSEPSSINGCGFLSVGVGNPQDFGAKPAIGYAIGNTNQNVEVVAVHRKESSWGGGTEAHVVMEYEFFPEKASRNYSNSNNDDSVMNKLMGGSEASSVADVEGGEAAYCVSTTTGIESSSSIDLSLKLYY